MNGNGPQGTVPTAPRLIGTDAGRPSNRPTSHRPVADWIAEHPVWTTLGGMTLLLTLVTTLIVTSINALGDRVDDVHTRVSDVMTEVGGVRGEIGEVRNDLDDLEREVGDLQGDIGYIRGRLDTRPESEED